MEDLIKSDFTATCHTKEYPGISPKRPELSQAGRSVLITGGGTNIGKSIAEHFVRASATNVIIVGRRLDVLESAVAELRKIAEAEGSPSEVRAISADLSDKKGARDLFADLGEQEILLDVLVLNAAKFGSYKWLLENGMDAVWSELEVSLKGPMYLVEEFMKQNEDKKKFLVNVTTAAIHGHHFELKLPINAYILSKSAGTLFVQLLAGEIACEKLQIVSFHPGTLHNEAFDKLGFGKDAAPWNELSLPGAFAVWAASEEAAYLHGRIVWAAWDIEELAKGDIPKLIEADPDFLQLSVVGFKNNNRAPAYGGKVIKA